MSDWPGGIDLDPKLWRRADPPSGCADFLDSTGASVFKVPKPLNLSPLWDADDSVPPFVQHVEWCRRLLRDTATREEFWGYFVRGE